LNPRRITDGGFLSRCQPKRSGTAGVLARLRVEAGEFSYRDPARSSLLKREGVMGAKANGWIRHQEVRVKT